MTRTRTDDPDTWRVPHVPALAGLAATRTFGVGGRPHPRRVLAALVAFPLLLWGLHSSLPPLVVPSPGWWALLAAMALLAALTVATYVPVPGATRGGASPCAAAAMVFTVMGALALGTAGSSPFTGVPALVLAAMGLGQRVLGAAACPPRTP